MNTPEAKKLVENMLDDVDPHDYVDRLAPRYGIQQPEMPYLPPGTRRFVYVDVWLTGSRTEGYHWTENVQKATSFATQEEAMEELKFVYTYFANKPEGSLRVAPLPTYDMQ